ncbi:tight adherence protein C [Catenulispora sp. GP43]|uniref:type II secretion system F family protein n=1 Tax=Catenulispora sp. GP43 TaxID=3156263 RepID=UPI0035199715
MVAVLIGTGIGAGLWLLLIGLRPPAPRAASVLARLSAVTAVAKPLPTPQEPASCWSARAGRRAVPLLTRIGLPTARTRRDLLILGRGPEDLLAQQAATGTTGLILAPVSDLWFNALGLRIPGTLLVLGATMAAGVLFWTPVMSTATAAKIASAETRAALAMFLELAGSSFAAGGGVEQSLNDAAAIGDGPTFTKLRAALAEAELTRTPIPAVFGRLADELDSPDLAQLAASLSLTGSEGARIKDALGAKAQVLRARQLADVQAAAEAATERTGVPIGLMFFAFMIAIGFPSVVKVLAGLN